MVTYTTNKLDDYLDVESRESLIEAVVTKAEGIFLWVALAVKEMREQLENGAGRAALMQLVDSLPEELDSLFWHILKSISKPNRRKAFQTFAIIPLSTKWELPVTLRAYSFLDNYDTDTRFAERDERMETDANGISKARRTAISRKRLNGCCKGLVEPVDRRVGHSPVETCIAYTHRSVPEFLENKAIRDEIELLLTRFQAADALCQLVLAEFRLLGKDHYQACENFTKLVLKLRHSCRLDSAPYTFLRTWDTRIEKLSLYRSPTGLTTPIPSDVEEDLIYHFPGGLKY